MGLATTSCKNQLAMDTTEATPTIHKQLLYTPQQLLAELGYDLILHSNT